MADDVEITAGTGTVIAADEIGGVKYQRVKATWGPDGTANDADVATGKPMPVQLRGSDGTDRSNALPVTVASAGIASGAIASGAVASGAFASGALASGSVASGAIASGAIAAGAIAAGATSIAENEDVASADGDRGVKVMYKRTDTPANASGTDGDYEQPQISGGYIWVAPPKLVKVSSTQFLRPNDTNNYAANDAIADNTTAGSVTKLQWSIGRAAGIIRRIRIKHGMATQSPTLRLWFWDTTFTVAAGDNAAFSNPLTNAIGFGDVVVSSVGSDASTTMGWNNCDIPFTGATLFGLIQTLTAITTPTAQATFDTDIWYLPS